MSVTNVIRNPGTYIAKKWRLYRRLLFAPGVFYEEEAGQRGLRFEVLLILLIGAVGSALFYYVITQQLFSVVHMGPTSTRPVGAVILPEQSVQQLRLSALTGPLAGAFGLWIGYSLALYAVSWLYTDVGSVFHVMKNTAWALLPFLFFNVFRYGGMIATLVVMPTEELRTLMAEAAGATNPDNIAPAVFSYAMDSTITIAATVIGFVFVLWAGYIAAHGISNVRALDIDKGYRAAAVPTVGFILFVVLGMVGVL